MAIDNSRLKTDTLKSQAEKLISTADLMNAIQGQIFNLFTTGGEAANSSSDNFFCWVTPGIPVSASEFQFATEGLSGVVRANSSADAPVTSGSSKQPSVIQQILKKKLENIANKEFVVETAETKITDDERAKHQAEMDKHLAEERDIVENGPLKDGEKREVKVDSVTNSAKTESEEPTTSAAETQGEKIVYHGNDANPTGGMINNETRGFTSSELDALKAERTTLLYMQAENFANMVNFIPDVSGRFANGVCEENIKGLSVLENEGSLSDVYKYILTMSQVMESELDEKTKAKIEKFRGLLETEKEKIDIITDEKTMVKEPSPLVNAYTQKMAEYDAAALEYNSKRIAALDATDAKAVHDWALNANIYYNKVKAAKAAWVSAGYKNEYEQISAYIDQVMQRDMSMLKQNYLETLEKSTLTSLVSGATFPFTTISPANFAQSSGWTRFTFNQSQYDDAQKSDVHNHSVKVDQSSKSWFHKQHYSYGKTTNTQTLETTFNLSEITVEFEICQVNIVRPWFKPAFLHSKYWRFDQNNPDAKGQMLWDGKGNGILPAYPTAMILTRNLVIDFHEESAAQDFLHKFEETSHEGGIGVNIGLWGIGVGCDFSYLDNSKHDESETKAHQMGSKIVVSGMQIIGYRCHQLEVSPNPNPEITNWI